MIKNCYILSDVLAVFAGLLATTKLSLNPQPSGYTNQLLRTNNTELVQVNREVNGRSSPATHKLSRGGSGKKKEKCMLL